MSLFCRRAHAVVSLLSGSFRLVAAPRDGSSAPRGSRWAGLAVVVGLVAAGAMLARGAAPALADSCPNAQFRTGYSAYLPDCRAYEQVSAPGGDPYLQSQQGVSPFDLTNYLQASSTGDGLAYYSIYPPPGVGTGGNQYLATRGSSGWSTRSVIPPQAPSASDPSCRPYMFFSSDLSRGVLSDGHTLSPNQTSGFQGYCASDDPQLVAAEPQGVQNLFLSDLTAGSYQLIDVTPLGVLPSDATFQAASADLSHVVFDESSPVTAGAPSGDDLYEWAGGAVRLVTVLPDGTPVQGSIVDPAGNGFFVGPPSLTDAVSGDGSRVFFTADGNLYVRENPMASQSPLSGGQCAVAADACTIQLDATQGAGPGGGGGFLWASSDGSRVFFSDDAVAGLTSDTIAGSGQNLYDYDLATHSLVDLTSAGEAGVQGVAGVSDDGAYVYFVADGTLASGATAGQPNLYVSHSGATTFIATLSAADSGDWIHTITGARVSPSGRFIGFRSVNPLTGYNNTDALTGSPDSEIFLYDTTATTLSCVSCDPSGAAPVGPAILPAEESAGDADGPSAGYSKRSVLDDGRVFFDTPDALAPRDTNGVEDVYEYADRQADLISSGTSADGSWFYDASASGNDVFFLTAQQLLGDGTDGYLGVYDARVGGGFPTSASSPPACADAIACHAGAAQPSLPIGATVTFFGPGNVTGADTRAGKLRVTRAVVRQRVVVLTVTVPGGGRVVVSGERANPASKLVARSGSYEVIAALTTRAREALLRAHRLKVSVRVAYVPRAGTSSAADISLTLRTPLRTPATQRARRPSRDAGGAR